MRPLAVLLTSIAVLASSAAAEDAAPARPALEVHADFPGGSVQVDAIDQAARLLRIQPADHPGHGWRCWWYFRVTGLEPGETLGVEVSGGAFALPDRAAFSLDGRSWRQTAPGERSKGAVAYRLPVDGREVWLAWGPPYLPSDAEALLKRVAAECPGAATFDLCRTREDRPVPALRMGPPDRGTDGRPGVWIQARQHAWESGSSWVCQGLVEWLASQDPQAEAARSRATFAIVPIMDVDNVVRGAGGKDQPPQDHNRDWSASPHWPSVAAAQRALAEMDAGGRLALFVDLHNPDAGAREPYFYTSPRSTLGQPRLANLDAFLAAAHARMTGPLPFKGLTKESGAAYSSQWQQISKNWVVAHTGEGAVAVTLETPWNTPHSTPEGYRQVGRELGLAIAQYLERTPIVHAE